MRSSMNRTRDAHVEGQGRGLVAARDLGRGEVVLRDVALAVGANEVDLLRNCFAAAPARRCIDDELCSLSYESLDVNARTSLADTISGVNDLLDFFAPFASDVGDGEQFDDGSDASWARRASLRLECNVLTCVQIENGDSVDRSWAGPYHTDDPRGIRDIATTCPPRTIHVALAASPRPVPHGRSGGGGYSCNVG
mmetsp:Transcript_32816/g.98804  ORF Transcript_32816/g.98804 Transcript_32816/m.98804 type:complete len:195 (+) Transcript_32816:164-748(+)